MATSAMAPAVVSKLEDRCKRRSSRSCLLSCFGTPAVVDAVADKEVKTSASVTSGEKRRSNKHLATRRGLWWSRFEAKKTVPLDVPVAGAAPGRGEADGAGATEGEEEKRKPTKRRILFRRFTKKKSEQDQDRCPNHHQHIQQQPQVPTNSNGGGGLLHVASKCSTRVEPAPLYRMHDRTRVATRTSHPGSPVAGQSTTPAGRPQRKGSYDPSSGLLVLAVALAMLLLGGLICATVCMCAWFYLLPRTRQPSLLPDATICEYDGHGEVDVSSEEHKKAVVLQCLLQRDRRKPSRNLSSTL